MKTIVILVKNGLEWSIVPYLGQPITPQHFSTAKLARSYCKNNQIGVVRL